ncbi:MAG: lysylphosphatidylglycerol synthase transmembrane domain-containing protein [Cytophagales bacterium]
MQINTKTKPFQIGIHILLLAAGIFLLYLAFRKQNFAEIWQAIQNANLWMLIPVLVASIVGLAVRALRWQIILKPLGFSPNFINTFSSMMVGYAVNYAIPRVGEITRCVTLGKKEKAPATSLFGTVMAERLADLVMLGIVLGLTFVVNYDSIHAFFADNIFGPIINLIRDKFFRSQQMTIITLSVVALILGIAFYYLNKASKQNQNETASDIDKMVDETWTGLTAFTKIQNWSLFTIYTLIIWGMNFLTSYFWLLSFNETANFPISAGITIYAISTVARSVPIQGGAMGAYHYLVTAGLAIFGIGAVVGNAYAILNHGSQMVLQLVLGAICGLYLLFSKNKDTEVAIVEVKN